mgnify:CR=1 FL=1
MRSAGNRLENETAIIDDGIIDSLDIVAVISELMEEFDVQLGCQRPDA